VRRLWRSCVKHLERTARRRQRRLTDILARSVGAPDFLLKITATSGFLNYITHRRASLWRRGEMAGAW
jgi:hypothetical protein